MLTARIKDKVIYPKMSWGGFEPEELRVIFTADLSTYGGDSPIDVSLETVEAALWSPKLNEYVPIALDTKPFWLSQEIDLAIERWVNEYAGFINWQEEEPDTGDAWREAK